VRLVFAPEFAIAQFGGDRGQLHVSALLSRFFFFRAYENGNPLPRRTIWSGAKEASKMAN